MAPVTVYYIKASKQFWGRSTSIVLTLDHAGVEFEIKDKSEAPEGVGFTVPIITLESGQHLSQTLAILNALGDKYGLNGKTVEEKNVCLQTKLDLNDMLVEIKPGILKENPERLEKWLSVFEARLQGTYFGGDSVSTADFLGKFVFTLINFKFGEDYQEKFPNLKKWNAAINEVPAVKKMNESGVDIMPVFMKKK